MLARLLHLGGLNATIFEGEASLDFRSQGGTLDLHGDTGLAAMKAAGLFEEFKKHGRYEGQYLAMVDKDLKQYFVRNPEEMKTSVGERPEIDRANLREILFKSLPENTVQWGHRLKEIDNDTLVFEHTTVSGFDLVVGADGAWSKVRTAIASEIKPIYTGVGWHELSIPDAEKNAPEMYKIVNRGSVYASHDGQRLSIQQMGDGRLHMYANFVREDSDWMDSKKCGYDAWSLEETKEAMAKEFESWCPEVRNALGLVQGASTPRSHYMLPVGAKWAHKQGFTLIGDAAHLMTPYAGEGVNQALDDALLLARAILKSGDDKAALDGQVKIFEDAMFGRVKKIQQLSYDLLRDWMFTPGVPKSVISRVISRHAKSQLPTVLHPIGTLGVYSYFFFRNLVS